MSKTLIIHDRFQFRGGAERMVLDMCHILDADLVTEFWTPESFPQSEAPKKVTVLDSGEPALMVFRYFRAQWNFWWKTRNLIKQYDTIIFSGNNCLAAAIRPLGNRKKIFYCHAPVRYVYDLLPLRRREEKSFFKRLFYYDLGKYLIRAIYRLGLSRMDTIFANSKNVQDRLKRFCQTNADILYPPIHTERFQWMGQGDYYLSWGRLDPLKRIDDIVKAFQQMPDKKLIIASGGVEEERIREMTKNDSHITVLGWVDDAKLKELVGNCIATIYIPIDEDFGMSPVESMAAGKPCIGVNEGGLKETIFPNQNGLLIPATYHVDDLVKAIQTMTPDFALSLKESCIQTAKRFSLEAFAEKLKRAI